MLRKNIPINTSPGIYKTHSTQHHPHNSIYTTSPNTPSSTQHHPHITINTSPSTQHHLHNTIHTTPSTQNHLHYIIKHWPVQHLGHCHFTPSASFLLIPLFVFLRCGLFFVFVSLTYSTVGCPKILLTCGVIRSYNCGQWTEGGCLGMIGATCVQ